jgi:cob(I)alamin adenosyltransferase
VVPGVNEQSAQTHLARAICRRAERATVKLSSIKEVNPFALKYLNRLSDAFFVIARKLAREDSEKEVVWEHERP